jgi:hypothetical protein
LICRHDTERSPAFFARGSTASPQRVIKQERGGQWSIILMVMLREPPGKNKRPEIYLSGLIQIGV